MKPGESVRVFPLSNWTELDVWRYVERECIPVVPLYFSAERDVVERDGMILMVDDERFRLADGEQVQRRRIRFRTLGCYPLTGAVESEAADISAVVAEMERATTSERQGRAIDKEGGDHAMERKKSEGYF
jgi:sulfate adenylyltransferase subunit 2